MALGYQNPFYLKQAQQKEHSFYNGKILLEKHDPSAMYYSEETLQLSQESHLKMKQLNKEIKMANYAKINQLSRVATEFVQDFKSLAKEADESLTKQKALEFEIERLLRAVICHDIMSIMQRVDNTAMTRRPYPSSITNNDMITSPSKCSCIKNKEVEVKEHDRNLLLSKNKKHISKDKAPEEIKIFLKKITVLLQAPFIIVRTNNGTEFKNKVLQEYFNSVGLSHQVSSFRTPQQNRVVERRNRTLMEATRRMIKIMGSGVGVMGSVFVVRKWAVVSGKMGIKIMGSGVRVMGSVFGVRKWAVVSGKMG
nr:ribonuclease H-like domain-containing protein [Tanacetum cinerariifolium]